MGGSARNSPALHCRKSMKIWTCFRCSNQRSSPQAQAALQRPNLAPPGLTRSGHIWKQQHRWGDLGTAQLSLKHRTEELPNPTRMEQFTKPALPSCLVVWTNHTPIVETKLYFHARTWDRHLPPVAQCCLLFSQPPLTTSSSCSHLVITFFCPSLEEKKDQLVYPAGCWQHQTRLESWLVTRQVP